MNESDRNKMYWPAGVGPDAGGKLVEYPKKFRITVEAELNGQTYRSEVEIGMLNDRSHLKPFEITYPFVYRKFMTAWLWDNIEPDLSKLHEWDQRRYKEEREDYLKDQQTLAQYLVSFLEDQFLRDDYAYQNSGV